MDDRPGDELLNDRPAGAEMTTATAGERVTTLLHPHAARIAGGIGSGGHPTLTDGSGARARTAEPAVRLAIVPTSNSRNPADFHVRDVCQRRYS